MQKKAGGGLSLIVRKQAIFVVVTASLREAAKKVIFLVAVSLRPLTPPPLELNSRRNFGRRWKKNNINIFSLMGGPLLCLRLLLSILKSVYLSSIQLDIKAVGWQPFRG